MTKAKVRSIASLLLLALWTALATWEFRTHDWTWLALAVGLMVMESYDINRFWAWKPPKPKDPEDNNKTKELKQGWKDEL